VLNLESINAAMDCLEKALQEYPGRTEKNSPQDSANVPSVSATI